MNIKYKLTTKTAKAPEFQTAGAAGADLYADNLTPVTLYPGARVLIPTGVILSIPEGYEGQVRSRSGLANKFGVAVLNSPGTLDSDFRGIVQIVLINLGNKAFVIKTGDRIAQLVVAKVERPGYDQVTTMDTTDRGEGSFGSTGGFTAAKETPVPQL